MVGFYFPLHWNMDKITNMNKCNDLNQKIGYWITYDGDNNKLSEGNYVNGKKDGDWILYRFDGTKEHKFHQHELEVNTEYCNEYNNL